MEWDANMDKKKIILVGLISAMLVSALTPIVMAVTEEGITITFDPSGNIDIDVSPNSYDFGTAGANDWTNSTGSAFTLYNNGSTSMDTQIKTNATTDSGEMTLDPDGTAIPADNYSLNTSGLDANAWITTAYGADVDSALEALGSKGFDLCLLLADISQDWTQQTTTVYFQGSISG